MRLGRCPSGGESRPRALGCAHSCPKWSGDLALPGRGTQPFFSNSMQRVMSKRAQESTSEENSAVDKPRPMNLVSRNLLSAKKDPLQDSSDPNSLGNQELDQSRVSSSGRKLMRNINPNPTMYFQEEQQDDTQSSSTRKLGGEMHLEAQPAPRNCSEVKTSNSEGQRCNPTKCRSPTIDP